MKSTQTALPPGFTPERMEKLASLMYISLNSFLTFWKASRIQNNSRQLIIDYCRHEGLPLQVVSMRKRKGLVLGGYTNGQAICLNLTAKNHVLNTFSFFHELGHFKLHFDQEGHALSDEMKEIEADSIALFAVNKMFPGHYDEFLDMTRNNPSRNADFKSPFKPVYR